MPKTISVLGAGMFGTAIANILAENGQRITLWSRDEAHAESIKVTRENAKSLPGYKINDGVEPTSNLQSCLEDCDVVFFCIPSSAFREVVKLAQPALINPATMVISTTKGIESAGFNLMSDVLRQELPAHNIGVLSGPNFAEEIVQKQLTATVVASKSSQLCELTQEILHTAYFRVYSSDDIYGVELAGALKNIYAIAAGFGAALGVGQNTLGMLLTRSLAEMSRFAHCMGAKPLTFLGLAGVGDLIVTCGSPLSRNYQLGWHVGKGLSVEQATVKLGRLAEGLNTVSTVKFKATELDVYMPIVNGLYNILFKSMAVNDVINDLMMADQPNDVEFVVS
ncbi:MAG: NAD(P)H-dependent glycerol-3-phosphate dehydrogenase [Pseudomonadales bacterium]|nr:NAD(P)H-dependent glycerol-3-phosphate dehydrogenase [Pseudomonadales bacterium]